MIYIFFFISVIHEKRYFLKATGHCGQLFSIANFLNFYNLPIIAKCASALGRVWISANVGLRFIILITQFIAWSSSSVFIRRYPFKLSPRTLRWSGFILSLALSYAVRSVTFSTSCCVFVAILIGTLRSEISFSFFFDGPAFWNLRFNYQTDRMFVPTSDKLDLKEINENP